MPKVKERIGKPRGGYSTLPMDGEDDSRIQFGYFPQTMQLAVTRPTLSRHGRIIEDIDANCESIHIQIAGAFQMSQKMPYLYELMDEIGFRVYAIYLLGEFDAESYKLIVKDIYAGVPGQGAFISPEQVAMFAQTIGLEYA